MWACAKSRLRRELLREMMPAVVERTVVMADGLDGLSIATIIWATARLRSDSPDLLNALPVMAEIAERRASDMSIQGLANSLWAVAALQDDAPVLLRLAPCLVAALVAKADRSNPQDVASSIWAIARLGGSSPELLKALPAFARAAERCAPDITAQAVANIVWAAATLRDDAPVLTRLMPSLVSQLPRLARHMDPQAVATIVWSAGALQLSSPLSRGVSDALLPRAEEVLTASNALDIMMLCHGMAASGWRDAACLKSVSRAVISMGPTWQGTDVGRALSMIAWAFARLDARSMAMLRTIADLTSTMLPKLGDWNLCALVWSYRKLDTGDKFAAFRARLESEVTQRGIPAHLVDRSSLGLEHWRSKT